MSIHPLTCLDYPDPDVIRVGNTYYMVSTTMHFFPGGEILRSGDLVHWEHAAYVYDRLDSTPGQCLQDGQHAYGKGMWAGSLRHHNGKFYLCFVANDTHKTYLYTASDIGGPWEKRNIEGFYHDCSLLFDQDGRIYIVHGNRDVRLTELKEDLSGPKPGGLDRILVSDAGNPFLGYEGAHLYHIGSKYVLCLIHSRRDRWRRTEACFVADSLTGEFVGGDVVDDDMGYCGQGVAQGGLIDTPDGKWYAVLFQDRGAVGRIPVLLPVHWEDGCPQFGEKGRIPAEFPTPPAVDAAPLVESDDFTTCGDQRSHGTFGLKSCWQFNHEPDLTLTHLDRDTGRWTLTTGSLCSNVTQARNTLTQRMLFPHCAGEITVNAQGLKVGDVAGLCALQGCYGLIGLTRTEAGLCLTMRSREADNDSLQGLSPEAQAETEWACIPWNAPVVQLRAAVDFNQMRDEVQFLFRASDADAWTPLGPRHKLYFKMDHFVGCRFGLFLYGTQEIGGSATFSRFVYEK